MSYCLETAEGVGAIGRWRICAGDDAERFARDFLKFAPGPGGMKRLRPAVGRVVDGAGNTVDEAVVYLDCAGDLIVMTHGGLGCIAALRDLFRRARIREAELPPAWGRQTGAIERAALPALPEILTARGVAAANFQLTGGLRAYLEALVGRPSEDIRRVAANGARLGKVFVDPPEVVIAGPENAGKSTLMNMLLDEDRAVVSETAGTTRDPIDGLIALDGFPFRLVDTAGRGASVGDARAKARESACERYARAGFRLWVSDVENPVSPDGHAALWVVNKQDLRCLVPDGAVGVSAKTGAGRAALERRMIEMLFPAGDDVCPMFGAIFAELADAADPAGKLNEVLSA